MSRVSLGFWLKRMQLAIEDTEDLALASGVFHDSTLLEKRRPGLVKRLSCHAQKALLGKLHLRFGRCLNYSVSAKIIYGMPWNLARLQELKRQRDLHMFLL